MNQLSEHLQRKLERDQMLLDAIKAHLSELELLLFVFGSDYEDRIYRFYYQSLKVYSLQDSTAKAATITERSGSGSGFIGGFAFLNLKAALLCLNHDLFFYSFV